MPVIRDAPARDLPKRMRPIFRDREEFAASADLGIAIATALGESQSLVVLCSPAAARSRWVNEEIATFRRVRDPARAFAVLVDGAPEDAFPAALTDSGVEPLAADLRTRGAGFRDARLRLVAALLGLEFDALKQRERARVRASRLRIAAIAVVTLVLFSLAAFDAARLERANLAQSYMTKASGLLATRGDLARVLAAQASAVDPGPDTHAFMQSVLRAHPSVAFYLDGKAKWLRYTPAGDRIFGISRDESTDAIARIFEWDAVTGRHAGPTFQPARAYFSSFAVSPDGRWIASYGDGDGTPNGASLFVWDARDGAIARRIPAIPGLHGTRTNHLAFVNNNLLFSYEIFRVDGLLDVGTGRFARPIPATPPCGGPDALSEDGSAFATLEEDGRAVACTTRDGHIAGAAPTGVRLEQTGFGYYAFNGMHGLFAAQTTGPEGASFVTWTSIPHGPHGTLGNYASGPRPQLVIDRDATRIATLSGSRLRSIGIPRAGSNAAETDIDLEDVVDDQVYGASMYLTSPPDFGADFSPDGSRIAISTSTDSAVYDVSGTASPQPALLDEALRRTLCRTANVPRADVEKLAGPDAECLRSTSAY